jgi:hypothetical protein
VDFHKVDAGKSVVLSFTNHYMLNIKSRMGTVNFAVVASTHPNVANTIHTQLSEPTTSKLGKRGLFSSIHDALEKAVNGAKNVADDAANKVKDTGKTTVSKLQDGGQSTINKIEDGGNTAINTIEDGGKTVINKIEDGGKKVINCACVACSQWCYFLTGHLGIDNHNNLFDIHPTLVNTTKNGTVFKQAIGCPPLTLGIDIEMNIHAELDIAFSVSIIGTLIPPVFMAFKLIPGMWIRVNTWMYDK